MHKLTKDLTGKKFGLWTVLSLSDERTPYGNLRWLCECECGTVKTVLGQNLRYGQSKSCGCAPHGRRDITGDRFGRLIAVERMDEKSTKHCSWWLCRCDCGNTHEARLSSLHQNKVRSCGCMIVGNGAKYLDIAGERYGMLVAIKPTTERKRSNTLWLCKCDCGNECGVPLNYLRESYRKSCGCLRFSKWREKKLMLSKDRHLLDTSLTSERNLSLFDQYTTDDKATLESVGAKFGITRERTRQIVEKVGKLVAKSAEGVV